MGLKLAFSGPKRYVLRSSLSVARSMVEVAVRRALHGPKLPGWNWEFELATHVMRSHLTTAFRMKDVEEARQYLDAVLLNDTATISRVRVMASDEEGMPGDWFAPSESDPAVTMLYLHGGGFSFYPKTYVDLIASVTLAANSRTLALDYRLSPEHRFPAALEDVIQAYQTLLQKGVDPERLIVAGDSAGGNLTLALLISVRDLRLPLPALAIALSPATDFVIAEDLLATTSFLKYAPFDWIQPEMLAEWASWYCDAGQRKTPLVSPIYADFSSLPPIYIQAGRAEILFDSIEGFVNRAKEHGSEIVFDTWEYMNHDFQMLGHFAPQSVDALRRIGELVRLHTVKTTGKERVERDPSSVDVADI